LNMAAPPRIGAVLAVLASISCQAGLADEAQLVRLDEPYFRCRVQPVLTKSCSAFACHGDGQRYFRVYARNRLRLGGSEAGRNALLRDAERQYNFASARGFVDETEPGQSLLLLKALDERAGGYYHGGATEYGQGDVFASREDPDFLVVSRWVEGAEEDPTCQEPGSDL